MEIDRHLPVLLEARGMSRRRIAVCLRLLEGDGYHLDARNAVEQTLLSSFHLSYEPIDSYDVPIANGVRWLHVARSGAFGRAYQSSFTGPVVVTDQRIPQSAAMQIVGKPLRTLVDHPELPGDRLIREVDVRQDGTHVLLENDLEDVAVLAPARRRDIDVEKALLAWERHREAKAVGATMGVCVNTAWRTAMIAVPLAIAAIVLGMLFAWFSDPARERIMALTVGGVALVTLAMLANQEDDGLSKRVDWSRSERRSRLARETYTGQKA